MNYRYLATGDSFVSLSCLFRVSNQCIGKIVFETSATIWSALEDHVMKPSTEDEWLKIAAEFLVMWNIPHCIGAVDGKHVAVRVIYIAHFEQ